MPRSLVVAATLGAIVIGVAPTASAAPRAFSPTMSGPQHSVDMHMPMSPASQQNAVRKAEEYLSISAFSREGLISQLEYEGFSTADATFAVDSITVDWNEQAVKKAQEYLSISAFSPQGLVEQLEYEGFTASQAAYGVSVAYQ
ncbi:Ltp family lipoprotein [Mycolicibacterium litorale]|uniref:Putative host cell surface-exposed lipoprotein Ltp-like HTH region domain-containing protein n=1 Tax=Mycolicibacterium litorale TaxID=758802 RepID=A0AAD1MUM7_9MYCO|nr:Ltp family lipoprotein [Mycolicibacterium litorale]TDY08616.1 host cell surface-exposed lipoprotein [Mycolicibacterium litorale]BBY16542.1 hypothetical protein MLIT_21340 [Mycolicibacterium litorale]